MCSFLLNRFQVISVMIESHYRCLCVKTKKIHKQKKNLIKKKKLMLELEKNFDLMEVSIYNVLINTKRNRVKEKVSLCLNETFSRKR